MYIIIEKSPNLVHKGGIEVDEALRMCSLYPARVLGLDKQYGRVAPGYSKEFVLLDDQWENIEILPDGF
jgi:N-acetylglucosamine-6-phosphate deacetylase